MGQTGTSYDENTSAYNDLRSTGGKGGKSGGGGRQSPGDRGPHPGGRGGDDEAPKAWEPDKEDRVRVGGGSNTGGGNTFSGRSGGFSGGGGGSSVAPGMTGNPRDDRLIAQAENLYYQLWGEYPATGYAKALVKKGLNIFEIEDHERRKPAFKKSDVYQDEYTGFAKMIASVMGTR